MLASFDISSMVTQEGQVKDIPIASLKPYHNHKFTLYEGERLDDMVENIRRNGVLVPILVQPDGEYYEILSGHNRTNAAKLAGLDAVPAIIKENLSEDEAEIYVIETNVAQRSFSDLKITEQAEVIKLRHSKMFSDEKRKAIDDELEAMNSGSKGILDKTGDEYGLKKDSVARLLRVSMLIPQYADWINSKQLSVRAAVELSYLSNEKQQMIYEAYSREDGSMVEKIDMKKAKAIRKMYEDNNDFTGDDVVDFMNDEPIKSRSVKISPNDYAKYFGDSMPKKEVEETIQKALDEYYKAHNIPLYKNDETPF